MSSSLILGGNTFFGCCSKRSFGVCGALVLVDSISMDMVLAAAGELAPKLGVTLSSDISNSSTTNCHRKTSEKGG